MEEATYEKIMANKKKMDMDHSKTIVISLLGFGSTVMEFLITYHPEIHKWLNIFI